jgi:hypothetical protein
MKEIEDIDIEVVLKTKEGRKKRLKGKIALAVIEAIKLISRKQKTLPKNASLAEAVAMAICIGYITPKGIADYIERYIQFCASGRTGTP